MFTAEEIKNTLSSRELIRVAPKVGTTKAGGVTIWGDRLIGENVFYVVPQEAYYKFCGNAQIAVFGKKNEDYFEFKTASQAAKKGNQLLNELNKKLSLIKIKIQ